MTSRLAACIASASYPHGCMVFKYVKPTVPMTPALQEAAPTFKRPIRGPPNHPTPLSAVTRWRPSTNDPELNSSSPRVAIAQSEPQGRRSCFKARAQIHSTALTSPPLFPLLHRRRPRCSTPLPRQANTVATTTLATSISHRLFEVDLDHHPPQHQHRPRRGPGQRRRSPDRHAQPPIELAIDYFEARTADGPGKTPQRAPPSQGLRKAATSPPTASKAASPPSPT